MEIEAIIPPFHHLCIVFCNSNLHKSVETVTALKGAMLHPGDPGDSAVLREREIAGYLQVTGMYIVGLCVQCYCVYTVYKHVFNVLLQEVCFSIWNWFHCTISLLSSLSRLVCWALHFIISVYSSPSLHSLLQQQSPQISGNRNSTEGGNATPRRPRGFSSTQGTRNCRISSSDRGSFTGSNSSIVTLQRGLLLHEPVGGSSDNYPAATRNHSQFSSSQVLQAIGVDDESDTSN
ncbi:uncharacterized protein [Dysidea avara]|uniref:uncharacterized protein isoform X2 n=1 Tax=Dysidea avara TaxID=196820 RepID=UPI00332DC86F